MSDKRVSAPSEVTSVDLGEDLLEQTKEIVIEEKKSESSQPNPSLLPSDDIEKAEILISERLLNDAKKILRKILRKDPVHFKAKGLLEEIQKQELQDLLSTEVFRKKFHEKEEKDNPYQVLEKLDNDLRIGVFRDVLKPVPQLFSDETVYRQYSNYVQEVAAKLNPKEKIDLGVAFLEMGLYRIAENIFSDASRNDAVRFRSMYLLAISLIYGGKAIEATIQLTPLVRDLALAGSPEVIDFLYLMGLAFEKLLDARKAREFFKRVYQINPRYRDVAEKLR